MKQFMRQVLLDEEHQRFYARCAQCEKRFLAGKLPLRRRNQALLARCLAGAATGAELRAFHRSHAAAVKALVKYLNRCPACGEWVCDDCFDLADGYGRCRRCARTGSGPAR